MSKLLKLLLAEFANFIGRVHINQISFSNSGGTNRVRKRRFRFDWVFVFLGNLAFRFRRVPLRVLYKAEWIDWERKLKLLLRNETVSPGTELLCDTIPGQPLSEILCEKSLQESDLADKLAFVRLATRALLGLHGTSIQLNDGQPPTILSHGDAAVSNVLCCAETNRAEWFDFDLRHDYRTDAINRHADDLRSLLFSAGGFLPFEAIEPLVKSIKQEYCCEDVWAALQRQVASGWFWTDLFHLSQTRRLRAKYRVEGLSVSQLDKVLVDLILKTN